MTLQRTIEVGVSAVSAFRTWTERVALWWPPNHSLTGEPGARMAFEGAAGGRLVERGPSGREVDWGRILAWEPPRRLVYSFFAGSSPQAPSEVEVAFEPLGEDRTRVVVTHTRGLLSEDAWTGTRKGFEAGWAALLPAFTRLLSPEPPEPS